VAIGHEQVARRAQGERLGERPAQDESRHPLRAHVPDLALGLLPRRLGGAVRADPQPARAIGDEDARPRHLGVAPGDHAPARIEPHHGAGAPVRHVEAARRIHGDPLGLAKVWRRARLRPAAREQLGAAVHHPVEHADLPVAIVGRDEQLALAPEDAHLWIRQRRPEEEARLGARGQVSAARGNPVEAPQILDLPARHTAGPTVRDERPAGSN
jgi:hypothetical protein